MGGNSDQKGVGAASVGPSGDAGRVPFLDSGAGRACVQFVKTSELCTYMCIFLYVHCTSIKSTNTVQQVMSFELSSCTQPWDPLFIWLIS